MTKYIDAEKLKAEIERELSAHDKVDRLEAFEVGKAWNRGHRKALENILSIIDSLQQEQQKDICHKCIHHGKDDDYCYNPHGGIRRLINENGIYECTGFVSKNSRRWIWRKK